jgi:hypothetical protein
VSWHAAFKAVEPYIVKIQTPAGAGSGFFFAYNEDKSLVGVATALHVLDEANEWRQPLKVIHVQTSRELFLSHGERGILVDYRRDSAAILIPTKAVTDAGLPVPTTMLKLLPSTQFTRTGVALAWAGYPAIAPSTLCLFQGGVSAFNRDNDSYYIDGIAINGVSGGPVFDDDDNTAQIVGIVSAYHYNRQGGGNLPGLLMAYDATHLNATVEKLKSLDEARKKASEITKAQKEQERESQSAAGPPEPETPRQHGTQPDSSASEPPRPVKRRPRRGGQKP